MYQQHAFNIFIRNDIDVKLVQFVECGSNANFTILCISCFVIISLFFREENHFFKIFFFI